MDYILAEKSMKPPKRLGLIINPIAGLGGTVGLKGTDGPEILAQARALGAVPRVQERVLEALAGLSEIEDLFSLLTCRGEMGEEAALAAGLDPTLVVSHPGKQDTSARDTIDAARAMRDSGVDLLLFAGGDGTARDIFHAVGEGLVTLGIPAGVKIHSAVFSVNPGIGGEIASDFLLERIREIRACEVMDLSLIHI